MTVAVLHPRFDVLGGAEVVSLHVMRRLVERGARVRLLTFSPPREDLPDAGVSVATSPYVEVRTLASLPGRPPPLLDAAWLHRRAAPTARAADLWIGTYNEANLGRPGLQYIHHPLFADRSLLRRYRISDAPDRPVRHLYDAAARRLAHTSAAAYRRNETLTNSAFMAGVLKEAYDLRATVLYPAFLTTPPHAGGARELRMVALGRITPDKHTHHVVDLMATVHRVVPEMAFVVAGYAPDPAYLGSVGARARAAGVPIKFVTNEPRERVLALLRSSRFFLSAKPFEHFGISTLEAAHAGTLPFVHRSGGSLEIVTDSRLWYTSAEDLGAKVQVLARSPAEAEAVGTGVRAGLDRFERARFDEGLDAAIERALGRGRR